MTRSRPGGPARLPESGSGAELTPLEIADALWLWAQVGRGEPPAPAVVADGLGPPAPDRADAGEPARAGRRPHSRPPATGAGDATGPDGPAAADPAGPQAGGRPPDGGELAAEWAEPAGRVVVARPAGGRLGRELAQPALPVAADLRALRRALRPLRRLVDSAREETLDEEATAERLVQEPFWLPAFRPVPERLWEIVLVVDASPSMTVWLDTVRDLSAALERLGVFRDVRLRRLVARPASPGPPCLQNTQGSGAAVPGELLEPSGRRIVWVLTDAVAPSWRDGRMSAVLWSWARVQPVAVVDVLPQRLWRRSGLRTEPLRMKAADPGASFARPQWSFEDDVAQLLGAGAGTSRTGGAGRAVPVPVLELNERWLAPWAALVAGQPGWTRVPAILADPDRRCPVDAGNGLGDAPDVDGDPEQAGPADRVQRFRALASPPAFAAATHLAAVPLNLAVLRLVQEMVGADTAALSEIFLGDLIRAVGPEHDLAAADRMTFDFESGVREELLECGRRSDTRRMLRAVGGLLGPRIPALRDLNRVVDDPDAVPAGPVADDDRRYVQIEQLALSALSGRYLARSRALRALVGAPAGVDGARAGGGAESGPVHPATASIHDMTTGEYPRVPVPLKAPEQSPNPPARAGGATFQNHPEGGGSYVSSITADHAVGGLERSAFPAVWGNVPPRNPNFTGRRELLQFLHERLHEGTTAVLPEAVHGMGGVGKSQLAVEYVYRSQADYDVIWWIPSERPAQISLALTELAQRLGLPVGIEANTAVPAVLEALRTGQPYKNWLLIFDNAEDPKVVRDFFPAGGGNGRILVTSRNPQWANAARSLEVNVFTREESKELLRRRGPVLDDADAERLAEALGDLPLAIEQAATWRAETGMPADEYLRLFDEKRTEMLGTDPPVDYEVPVAAAWNVSLDQLVVKDPAAARLLQVCSFFAPEPISRQLFAAARNQSIVPELDGALRDPIKLNRALREVNRYALARIDHRTNSIQMHRLVQAVLVGRMTPAERETMRHGAHKLLAAGDPNEPASSHFWSRYAEIYPHLVASGAIDCREPYVRELVLNEAKYLYHWGDHEGSRQLSQKIYERWRSWAGDDDPLTLKVASWLAWINFVVGRYPEAAELNALVYETHRRLAGEDDEDTLEALGNVAADRRVQGEFAEAQRLSEAVYRGLVASVGEDDPSALNAAHNLAVSLRLSGEFQRAAELDQDTWARKVQIFGEDHELSLITLEGLVIDRRELGDYLGARRTQEDILARYRMLVKDEDHPRMLGASRLLAVVSRRAGDHAAALELSREVLRRLVRRYNPDYPAALAAALNLSMDLRHSGDLAGALAQCQDTEARFRRIYGADHPHALAALVNLAITYRLAGDAESAHDTDAAALEGFRRRLGENHPSTLVCSVNLASDLYAKGEFAQARRHDEKTVDRCREILGDRHPSTLACVANLALDLRALDESAQAESLHAQTVAALTEALGEDHPATRAASAWVRSDCDIDPMPL
jgi:hypothetical protein